MIVKFTGRIEVFPTQTEKAEVVLKKKNNCSVKTLGHYKVTMGHQVLLRSPKGL